MTLLTKKLSALTILVLGMSTSLFGSELLTNGDFETGNFNSWSVAGPFIGMQNSVGHSGSHFVYCGAGWNDNGTIGDIFSQNVPTTPGASYNLSLWVTGNGGGGPAEVYIDWNNVRVFDLGTTNFGGWTQLKLTVQATAAATPFDFGSRNQPNAYYFDDASVQPTPLPEMSSLAFLSLGLLGLLIVKGGRNFRLARFAAPELKPIPLPTNRSRLRSRRGGVGAQRR